MRNDTRPDHAFAPLQHARCALRVLALCACTAPPSALAAGGLSLLEIGTRELQLKQQAFAETARQIDPGKKPIEVFQAIQKDHPRNRKEARRREPNQRFLMAA